jgi:hypothetical protein
VTSSRPIERTEFEAAMRAVLDEVGVLREEVVFLRDRVECPRCATDPPPPARWGGDPRATDTRRPHTCGKPRWTQ